MVHDTVLPAAVQRESSMIRGRVRRLLVLAAAMTGLLALFETAAHAGTNLNHCEPLRRS
jgi:hypothetical protein